MADKIEIDILATDNFSTTFKRLNGQLVQTREKQTFMDRGMKSSHTTITNYARGAKKASGAIGGLKGALGGAMMRFIGITAVIGLASKAIQVLVQWVGESIKEFRKFEKNVAEVSTILTGDAMKGFMEVGVEIERLSVSYGKSANDMAQGMYDILSAAFDAQEGMKLLETATKAAIAGITDVKTSVDVFTSILNAWGKTVAQATQISDQLFQTVVRGKLKFEDLASAMGYIAPIAANLGVEFKEIAAALSTVTRQGQHVDMATRGLALMLQNISDLAPAAAEAANKYGVDLSAVALRVGGLEYVIKDLNQAMKEHGAEVLPEMIRNMRSLRVAMALAGDEGVKGFTTDLGLLEKSEGRTEEAMAKMMNTSQQQADMLDQSMKMLERDIGEAWSGVDIWFKKAKLWWGSLISGQDPNEAVEKYETRANKIKIAAYEVMKAAEDMKGRTPLSEILAGVDLTKYDKLSAKISTLQTHVKEGFDFKNVKEFFKVSDEIEEKADFGFMLRKQQMAGEALKAKWDNLVIKYGIGKIPQSEIARLNAEALEEGLGMINFGDIVSKGASLGGFFDFWGAALTKGADAAVESTRTSSDAKQLEGTIGDLKDSADELKDELELLKEKQSILAESEQEFTREIDNAKEAITTHKENILTLQRALDELNDSVTRTYTTIAGQEFSGKDYWQVTSAGMEVAMDRFTRFSQIVIKYGGQMRTDYMDNIKGMVDDYEHVDKSQLEMLGSLEWYNKEIFNSIDGIEEFDGNMVNVIETIGDYTQKVKQMQKEQQEWQKELDASERKLLELNLMMQKIQLKGMMRRRGLTRMEEKQIQKIKIKQTQERIKQMEHEVEVQNQMYESGLTDLQYTVENAKNIYQEYVDRVKFAMSDMKDVQDEELAKFLETINMKEEKLISYGQLYQQEIMNLENSMANHQALMAVIATDPVLAENYRKMYGIDAIQEANREMQSYMDFIKEYNVEGAAPGGYASLNVSGTPLKEEGIQKKKSEVLYPTVKSERQRAHEWMDKNWGAAAAIGKPLYDIGGAVVNGLGAAADTIGGWLGFARGTSYIPKNMPIMAHRGEQIIPAGAGTGGDNFNVTINVNATVDNDYDVEKLAAKLGEAMQAKLINKKGKSTFRLR